MKTSTPKPSEALWFIADAKGLHLGRLAVEIAHVLRGKHKVQWSAHQVHSDHVVVVNAAEIILAGNKSEEKVYYRHSGVFGNLKTIPVSKLLKERPEEVITRAVKGMLPRNRLRARMLKYLHVYKNAEHQHEAQKPQPLPRTHP